MWVCQKIGYCTPNFQSSITIFPIWRAAFSRIPIEMSLSKIVVSQNLLTYWFVIMFPFKLLEWIHYFQRNPKIISVVGYIISIYPRRSPLNHGLIRKKNRFPMIFSSFSHPNSSVPWVPDPSCDPTGYGFALAALCRRFAPWYLVRLWPNTSVETAKLLKD